MAAPGERLSDYAARAGLAALEQAGMDPADLDLVIVATLTADEVTPNAAPIVADLIGAHRAGGFDVGSACNGFLTGVSVAAAQVEARRCERILVIGADFITRVTNWDDAKSAPLFGDAAGAVVLAG